MEPREWFMFFHFVGLGLIATMLTTAWLLQRQYKSASDYSTKSVILNSGRLVGMLSPFAILLILISGIGNMSVRDLEFTTETWLTVKICLFLVAMVNGIVFGIRSKKRGMLVGQMAKGTPPENAEKTLAGMDRYSLIFLIVQTILIIVILALAVWKPGTSRGA